MKYGPIEEILLLGGGELLKQICLWAISGGTPIKVVTSPRHAEELVDDEPLKEFLVRHKIRHLIVEDIGDERFKSFVGDPSKSFCLSVSAAWVFKSDIISSYFDNKLFNLHGMRLPLNRGGGGVSWQIIMGDRTGGCALHLIDSGIDTGKIVASDEFVYPPSCRKPIDYQKVSVRRNADFVTNFIGRCFSSELEVESVPQSEHLSSYWPRLNASLNGWIDWSMDPIEVERFICAFDEPYIGASTHLNGHTTCKQNL